MSTEKIFGGWDGTPVTGASDELSRLWHELAAQNVGTDHQVNNCGLSQRRAEITSLWELYRRARPKVVLEVGVAQGGTWASWCHLGQPDALLIGIDRDVNDCRPRKGEPVSQFLAKPHLQGKMTSQGGGMYAYARDNQVVVPISGWTTDPMVQASLTALLAGRTIDFCFHDASHYWEDFHKDFVWLWPLISEGGIFASHDISPCSDPKSNKAPEWERIKREETYSALMEFRGSATDESYGIGVLIK